MPPLQNAEFQSVYYCVCMEYSVRASAIFPLSPPKGRKICGLNSL